MLRKVTAALAATSALAMVPSAHAATVFLQSAVLDGGTWLYTYGGSLDPLEGVKSGAKLVVFDFLGYVPGSISSPSGNITTNASLTTNLAANNLVLAPEHNDDPNVMNLMWTYTGPDVVGTPAGITFGGLQARSTFGPGALDGFSTLTFKNAENITLGTNVYTTGSVTVPVVPEPSTWAMMLFGFGAVGAAMRRRKGKAARVTYSFA
jgi:hypothetical protein